jgi:hypothetical protein
MRFVGGRKLKAICSIGKCIPRRHIPHLIFWPLASRTLYAIATFDITDANSAPDETTTVATIHKTSTKWQRRCCFRPILKYGSPWLNPWSIAVFGKDKESKICTSEEDDATARNHIHSSAGWLEEIESPT